MPRYNWLGNVVVGNGGLKPVNIEDIQKRVNAMKAKKAPVPAKPKVEVVDFRTIPERSTRLPRFIMNYENIEEMQLRLRGSIVTIRDEPHYVEAIMPYVQEGDLAGPGYQVHDKKGVIKMLVHNVHGFNLRTPDPGYITIDDGCYFIYRVPAKVYRQGICNENTICIRAVNAMPSRLFGFQMNSVLKALDERPLLRYTGKEDFRHDFRLSDRVALVRDGVLVQALYKQNKVGFIEDGKVKLQVDNLWAAKALEAVGLEVI